MEHSPLQSFCTFCNIHRNIHRHNGLSEVYMTPLCVVPIFDGDAATVVSQLPNLIKMFLKNLDNIIGQCVHCAYVSTDT